MYQSKAKPAHGVAFLGHYQQEKPTVSGGFLSLGYWSETKGSLPALLQQKTLFSPNSFLHLRHTTRPHFSVTIAGKCIPVAEFYPMEYEGEVINIAPRLGP